MTTPHDIPDPLLLLERSLLDAMDAALDEADWRALDDLLNILSSVTLRTSQTSHSRVLH